MAKRHIPERRGRSPLKPTNHKNAVTMPKAVGSRRSNSRASVTTHRLAASALDEARLTLNDIADATGASRAALEKYRQHVFMPAAVRERLATYLEQHATKLRTIAIGLRAAAD